MEKKNARVDFFCYNMKASPPKTIKNLGAVIIIIIIIITLTR